MGVGPAETLLAVDAGPRARPSDGRRPPSGAGPKPEEISMGETFEKRQRHRRQQEQRQDKALRKRERALDKSSRDDSEVGKGAPIVEQEIDDSLDVTPPDASSKSGPGAR